MHSENCAMSDLLIETLRRIKITFFKTQIIMKTLRETGKLGLDFSPF